MGKDKLTIPELMWTPNPGTGIKLKKFKEIIQKKYDVKLGNYWDFHQWSIENIPEFWEEVWNFSEIIHSQTYNQVVDRNATFEDLPKWFEGARLNIAENFLKYRDNHVALILCGEKRFPERVTFSQMYLKACEYGAAFRKCGVKKGDRIACCMTNREEPVYAMLGATSIGAIWSGVLPLLGAKAVMNRFKLIKPKILLTMDRLIHNGEEKDLLLKAQAISAGISSLERVIIISSSKGTLKDISRIRNSCYLEEFLALGKNEDGSIPQLEFEQLPFDHPVFINYTSGTTGTPKPIMHGIGILLSLHYANKTSGNFKGLLTIVRDFCLHTDTSRESVKLCTSPPGWASWNTWTSLLFLGTTIVYFEGNPFFLSPTYLWDMVDEFQISNLFLTPSVLDDLENKGYLPTSKNHLNSLKVILSGSSVVKPQHFDFVYKKIKHDVLFGSAYFSTEMLGPCMMLDQTLPIFRGEISTPALGVSVCCYDVSGKSVAGEIGDIVITTITPNLPLGMWEDADRKKYKENYCNKFKGVLCPGDVCTKNPVTNGFLIYGRSDTTLKPKGARFGSSEIYNIVEEFKEVKDSLCVSQYNITRDERVVLFIRMNNGYKWKKVFENRLRKAIDEELSERYIPEVILEVKDIPYNMNGKKMENVIKKIINNLPYNSEFVANPECLKYYENIPELQGF